MHHDVIEPSSARSTGASAPLPRFAVLMERANRVWEAGERLAGDRARLAGLRVREDATRLMVATILLHIALWAGITAVVAFGVSAALFFYPAIEAPALLAVVGSVLAIGCLVTGVACHRRLSAASARDAGGKEPLA